MDIPEKVPVYLKHTIRDLRVRKGLSQSDAAKMMGVTEPTLRKWEKDSSNLKMQQIWKISKMYSIPQDYIFFGSNNDFIKMLDEHKEEI
ncbi:transcriptional repressor [Lactobacillus phage T25]|uniref:XRE family transcriptional regulator n=1 Tax=Lactobacillus phage T25 TaxID=2036055 RepID=A0A2Z6BEJ7_9CAUD|nr:transcriptional repressor [Lactobacillus phage T25]BBD20148.1 XRE family transcriptional regulator [Lactobacillus phage T25]